ncbi:MAG: aromatic amino acid lyase [Myxococcota bacterium]
MLDGRSLTPEQLMAVAAGTMSLKLGARTRDQLNETAATFAELGRVDILRSKWQWLVGGDVPTEPDQAVRAFIESHCAGVGEPLPAIVVRAMLVARANALAVGASGVRAALVERILSMLERGWVPKVPARGAVGAAGSIALAHVARVVLGIGGDVAVAGDPSFAPFDDADWPVFAATEKEALSLINGSSLTTGVAALASVEASRVLAAAEAACALTMEAVLADRDSVNAQAAARRNHDGIREVTERLAAWTEGSGLVTSKRNPDNFAVRCAPTVLGTARRALRECTDVVTAELNAPSDNPLWIDGRLIEGGHFHAAPVALAMDLLKTSLVQVAGIAERRIFRLTYGALSGLPSFLVPDSGVNSGLMLAQYTAASVTSEARMLTMPASVDSVPTVQHQEDHVSMGPNAARSARQVVERVADVIAIELLCAAQALDLRRKAGDGNPGPRTQALWESVRALVPTLVEDRMLEPDITTLADAIRRGDLPA